MTTSKGLYKSSKRGNGKTQTRIGMSIDNDLLEWLNLQPNKTRYINGLIRQDMEMHELQDEAKRRDMNLGEVLTDHREERESHIQDADFEEP